ncbi:MULTISPECIES: cation-translocating P-type ATPase [unclassified Ruminococcus]|uniref:cation-translocating P-type ATPase n=1 Tax=unclassified Ruminococcus TaxID=2608920 RepID=UPI00210B9D00|nr:MULTISPECIES: cation-translocating P-type ATPase [unclassified Ruminococcus]MCQ4022650.1 HAD-IC family P-type ATPase [Ruminococcus sp. zg-924]MCQ4114890.1 HAD-IC family P-type ATPase [Ruminococcus sp. zg-921]
MSEKNIYEGLTTEQAKILLQKYGRNELVPQKKDGFILKLLHTIAEPMFILLLVAAVIYFILGEPRDGAIMLVFVIAIITIDFVQEWKTDKTISALKNLSAPHTMVIRDGKEQTILSTELVPGDIMLVVEGVKIPADGEIIKCSDFCVNESSLTGESEGVWKTDIANPDAGGDYWRSDMCYAGTLCTQGSASILVTATGTSTEYGKIGKNVAQAPDMPTPLQKQTNKLVKVCAVIAAVLFVLVTLITFLNLTIPSFSDRLVESILSGITLAMAMIPEEFPVVLTVFLSMGAWRLARKSSLVRTMPSVETLGAVSVLCVDKTGTITMNEMTVTNFHTYNCTEKELCEIMGMACEVECYDPMEKAMLSFCEANGISVKELFSGELVTEYAFTNKSKMMGHVWNKDGKIIIAAKGSFEKISSLCSLSDEAYKDVSEKAEEMSSKGLRVIAVASQNVNSSEEIPHELTDCKLSFLGLVGLADPPRELVAADIETCKKAGIRVVMITGDNGFTASSIASQVGIENSSDIITGDMLEKMSDDELCEAVRHANIFSRVIPEHKMRIVKALRRNGEIVAMTGDGVNDAPALKYADIGIAMGKRGSEVSREAADLILLDDNFSTIVDTVRDGRRIFDNIRKAIGYIFTIHIPIALASLLAPMLGISSGELMLLPLHVVLLELLIDPTCSIVLERQPAESNIMSRPPRNPSEPIIKLSGIIKSIVQGIVIFAASFGTYLFILNQTGNSSYARSMSLTIIMFSNLLLVFVNSSEKDYAFRSIKALAHDKVMWVTSLGTIALVLLVLYSPINSFLKLEPLSVVSLLASFAIAVVSVMWYEIVKAVSKPVKKREMQE